MVAFAELPPVARAGHRIDVEHPTAAEIAVPLQPVTAEVGDQLYIVATRDNSAIEIGIYGGANDRVVM